MPKGEPYWDDVWSEELYDEPNSPHEKDDYDASERFNVAGDTSRTDDLKAMRRILKAEFATPSTVGSSGEGLDDA